MSHLVSRSLLSLVNQSAPRLVQPLHRALSDVSEELPALLARITRELEEGEVPEPRLSAEFLLSKSLSSGPASSPVLSADWRSHPAASSGLSSSQLASLSRLVQCRLAQVPLQYILGNWDFRNITLLCRPPVFIPRPETEQLVDLILDHLPRPAQNLRLLEVGPGTGAVSLAVLSETDRTSVASITCIERAKAALELTRDNAALLGLEDRMVLVPGRVGGEEELVGLEAQYDLIFSNPPYILRKDLARLAPQIALYEDLRALDGGADGLEVILSILELARTRLTPGGLVILEVDPCHPYILPEKIQDKNIKFTVEKTVKDFAGKDRFMVLKNS